MYNRPPMSAPPPPPPPQRPKPMKYYWDRDCYPYHDYHYYHDYDYDHNWWWWYDRNYISAEAPPAPPPPGGGGGYPPPPIIPKPVPTPKPMTSRFKESNIDGIDNGWYNYSTDELYESYKQGFMDGWTAAMNYCSSDNGYTGSIGYLCSMGYTGSHHP